MRSQQRPVEARAREDPPHVVEGKSGDPDLGVGMRWNEPAKARIVLPIERPADDDGVNGDSSAPGAHLLDEALDEIERAGTPAGHRAHCIELIDDQHSGAPRGLRRCRENECRGFLEVEASTKLRGRCRRRGHPIEPEREDRVPFLSQSGDELEDEGTFPRTCASDDDPVGGRTAQTGEQRFDSLVADEIVADESPANRAKVPVGSPFHGDGRVLGRAQGPSMETERFELLDEGVAGPSVVHGILGDGPERVHDGRGQSEEESLDGPVHLLNQSMLVNHPDVDPPQPIARFGVIALPASKNLLEISPAFVRLEEVLMELVVRNGIPGGFTQTAKPRGIAAGDEHELVVVAGQLLADGEQEPFGPQPPDGPLATGVASLGLMELAMRTRLDDELRLLDTGIFDAKGIGAVIDHPEKLSDRPPPLVAVPELVCRTTGESHARGSVSAEGSPETSRVTGTGRGLGKPMRCGALGRAAT